MKIWITRWALTSGIIECDGEGTRSFVRAVLPGLGFRCLVKQEFETSRADAVLTAETMRSKRIASLRQQIEKLEALRFDKQAAV